MIDSDRGREKVNHDIYNTVVLDWVKNSSRIKNIPEPLHKYRGVTVQAWLVFKYLIRSELELAMQIFLMGRETVSRTVKLMDMKSFKATSGRGSSLQ